MKKYLRDWPLGVEFDDFVNVGDHIDWEMYNHFYSNLMTVRYTGEYLQAGRLEYVKGRQTFFTFKLDIYTRDWVYYGHCHLDGLTHLGN